MGITALPVASIVATGNTPTSTSGPLPEDQLSAGLPAEFAALLAQLSGNQPVPSPQTNVAGTQPLSAEAGQEAGRAQLALTQVAPNNLAQLIQLQPYPPSTQEKSASDGVERSNLLGDRTQTTDAAQLLAATTLNLSNPPLANQHAVRPDLSPEAAADKLLLASMPGITQAPESPASNATEQLTTDLTDSSSGIDDTANFPISISAPETLDSTELASITGLVFSSGIQLRLNPPASSPALNISGAAKQASASEQVLGNSAQLASAYPTLSAVPDGPGTNALTSAPREVQPWQLSTANIAAEAAQTPPSGSAFAAALGTAQATQAQPPLSAASTTDIPTHLHDRQWGQNFSEKIVWLAKSDQQTAQININPPQLGPLQINLNINGDQASAVFTSAHAEVRQAIEDAMPRLREMLSSAGISLGQANVGAQLPQQNREAPGQFTNGTRFSNETAILPGDSDPVFNAVALQRGRGLVDLFA